MAGNGTEKQARRVTPTKFAHAVLRTRQLKEMVEWYKTVLQAETVHENNFVSFMTYDDEHHRIAIASTPNVVERPAGAVGLDHLAYTYASIGDLVFTYERLKAVGILPVVSVNHGPTTSLYYRDPDGNKLEMQVDNFATAEELKGFFKSGAFAKNPIGVSFDADELARKYHAGVPDAELKRYDAERGFDRDMMREIGR